MPYRVIISPKHCEEYHEAYFHNLPTKAGMIKSVEDNRKLADDAYADFYDLVEELVKNFSWPTAWKVDMSALGSPAYKSGFDKIPSNAFGYVRIHRFEFTE